MVTIKMLKPIEGIGSVYQTPSHIFCVGSEQQVEQSEADRIVSTFPASFCYTDDVKEAETNAVESSIKEAVFKRLKPGKHRALSVKE